VKSKWLVIESCDSCPFIVIKGNDEYECGHLADIDVDSALFEIDTEIPVWCPLPDDKSEVEDLKEEIAFLRDQVLSAYETIEAVRGLGSDD